MAEYAVIKDGVIVNVIVAESQEIAEQCCPEYVCIDCNGKSLAYIGGTYNGSDFLPPVTNV